MKFVDFQNAYVYATLKQRVWFQYGQEFGSHKGIVFVFIREMYCMKGAVSEWSSAIRQMMRYLGFNLCRADGYV